MKFVVYIIAKLKGRYCVDDDDDGGCDVDGGDVDNITPEPIIEHTHNETHGNYDHQH